MNSSMDLLLDLPEDYMIWERFTLSLTGVTMRNKGARGRQRILQECDEGDFLDLVRQPDNKYDRCAIAVFHSSGEQIGWIPAGDYYLARHLDSGGKVWARISKITGGPDAWENRAYGCVIEVAKYVPGGEKLIALEKEDTAIRKQIDEAKSQEKSSLNDAIRKYIDSLIRIKTLGQHPVGGRIRTVKYPMERLTIALLRAGRLQDCVKIVDWWEKSNDRQGISATDRLSVYKRVKRAASIIERQSQLSSSPRSQLRQAPVADRPPTHN